MIADRQSKISRTLNFLGDSISTTSFYTLERHQNNLDSYTTVRLVSAPSPLSLSLSFPLHLTPSDVLPSSFSSPRPSPAAVQQQLVDQGKMVQPEMEWNEWIKDYSKGHFPPSEPPQKPNVLEKKSSDETVTGVSTTIESSPSTTPRTDQVDSSSIETPSSSLPPLGRSSPSSTSSASSVPSISTSSKPVKSTAKPSATPQTPEEIYQFYQDKGYLPAPNGQFEGERLRTIKRYGLDTPERKTAIDRICRIAKAHFKTKTVIITL